MEFSVENWIDATVCHEEHSQYRVDGGEELCADERWVERVEEVEDLLRGDADDKYKNDGEKESDCFLVAFVTSLQEVVAP